MGELHSLLRAYKGRRRCALHPDVDLEGATRDGAPLVVCPTCRTEPANLVDMATGEILDPPRAVPVTDTGVTRQIDPAETEGFRVLGATGPASPRPAALAGSTESLAPAPTGAANAKRQWHPELRATDPIVYKTLGMIRVMLTPEGQAEITSVQAKERTAGFVFADERGTTYRPGSDSILGMLRLGYSPAEVVEAIKKWQVEKGERPGTQEELPWE